MPLAALRHKTRRGLPLWLEIAVVLAIKLLLLWWIKVQWFSAPLAQHMTVPDRAIEQQLLGAVPPSTSTGDNHATRR